MEIDYAHISEFIKVNLLRFESTLSQNSYEKLNHFWMHGEYEMAFEGLVLELFNANYVVSKVESEFWFQHAKSLGLDKKQSFDSNFWSKLVQTLET